MGTAGVAKTPSAGKPTSLTGSESFRLRIQRSEASRAALVAGVYATLLAFTLLRRFVNGVMMADDRVFVPATVLLSSALVYLLLLSRSLRRACAEGRLVHPWRLTLNSLVELGVPSALLFVLHYRGPLGPYEALSAPALLLLPLTVLLSVLRLRPNATLWMGLGAAFIHTVLVVLTIIELDLPASRARCC